MKSHLVLLHYFSIIIVISIYFYGFDRIYKNKFKLKFMRYKKIQWIRNLEESSVEAKELEDNSDSKLVLEKELLIGKNFDKSKISFLDLINVLLQDYDESLERKKNYLSDMYNTLISSNSELSGFLGLLSDSKSHIDQIFKDPNSFGELESELRKLGDANVTLHIDENDSCLLIDGKDGGEYLKQLNFNKDITLKIENSFGYFNKLSEKNDILLPKLDSVWNCQLHTRIYLRKFMDTFPLKYSYVYGKTIRSFGDSFTECFIVMNNFLFQFRDHLCKDQKWDNLEFFNRLFSKRKEKNVKFSKKIDITYLSSLVSKFNETLDKLMEEKINKLFMRINVEPNDEIKWMIAFIVYVLETDSSKNESILEDVESWYKGEFKSPILDNIRKSFLQEKDDIKKSLDSFNEYVQAKYNINVNSESIRSAVKRLRNIPYEEIIKEVFCAIAYSLLCKKQLNEYLKFIELFKSKKKKFVSFRPGNLMEKFLNIYEKSRFFNNLYISDIGINRLSRELWKNAKKFSVFKRLVHLLNKELIKLESTNFSSGKELVNKNVILFLLYSIKKCEDIYEKYNLYKISLKTDQ
ncbi:fam-f protein [Plasmodium relictum]|uniref:Fam-f protein n=1 Tax=Plasmodium relictum TaxID=85471 RepID=A0A1J1GP44_PLARL|nr:fam-f protein [Plasmodium relictum]CRG85072.1 fam-f protein [Plasmodium relictum]